jgi:subtilase family serine protease
MLVGCAAVIVSIASPGAATPRSQAEARITIAGNVPAWARPAAMVADANRGEQREIRVALGLRNQQQAEQLAGQIATAGSPRYRRPLSSVEFLDRFAPTGRMVDQVSAWLRGQGLQVVDVAENRHFVTARGPVERLEVAFGTRLGSFRVSGRVLTAPQSAVSVPTSVCHCITAVLGLDDQEHTANSASTVRPLAPTGQPGGPAPDGRKWSTPAGAPSAERRPTRPAAAAATPGEFCSRFWGEFNARVPQKYSDGQQGNLICGYTPTQLRGIYGLSAAQTGANQVVALTGNFNSPSAAADADRWARQVGAAPLAGGQYETVLPAGGGDPNLPCDREPWISEQAMDIEAVHSIAPAARIIWYSAEGCSALPALNTAVAQNRASIISSSWNLTAGENGLTPAFRDQLEAITIQAAIQGQALLFSSGDLGDNSRGSGQVNPMYPSTNPWVTAVGGTTVGVDSAGRVAFQAGWADSGNTLTNGAWVPQSDADGPFAGGASGGVSTLYDAPDYQTGVVPVAIARGKRAFPDIAALADGYTGMLIGYTSTAQGWVLGGGGGTSLASPVLAGLVANAQQAHGSTRFGFLNPALYALGRSAVTDVTPQRIGIWTPGMGAPGGVTVPTEPGNYLLDVDSKPQTLKTAPGWDPVTGLGTPTAGFVTALGS